MQDRARRTRRALIAAGSRAFAEQGFERSSLTRILRDGGVTKGAFHFHFSSKEELAATILGMEGSVWPEMARRILERPAGGVQNLIDFSFEAACRLLQDPVAWAGLRMRVVGAPAGPTGANRSPWTRIVRSFLEQADREGALRPGLDPGEVAQSWFEAFIGVYTVAAGGYYGKGSYFWGGAAGTWFWIDPATDLIVIGMIQNVAGSQTAAGNPAVREQSAQLAYAAMTDRR